MKLVQCWNDGVTTDVRPVSLWRRRGARAAFNLNAGLHVRKRQLGWRHDGTEVWRLGRDELREVYDGFSVANHTLTHPHLEQLPIEAARREIRDGRARLQALFDQPMSGTPSERSTTRSNRPCATMATSTPARRVLQRSASGRSTPWPRRQAGTFSRPISGSGSIARATGAFWFWGHSYEPVDEAMWGAIEASLARLCAELGVRWCDPTDLFDGDSP